MGAVHKIVKNLLPYGIVKTVLAKKETLAYGTSIVLNDGPNIYNKQGDKMMVYFLKDEHCKHTPHTLTYGRLPKEILWDRFDYQLKYHMYTNLDILNTLGAPIKKFAMQLEAEVIVPDSYKIFKKDPEYSKEFELVFTQSAYELNRLSNAVFLPCSTVWIGTDQGGGQLDENRYTKKIKNVSIIASQKTITHNQILRVEAAKKLKALNVADTFGRFDGGEYFSHVSDALEDYRFQVVVENECGAYAFTEKILNCFATMTIPIYFGAEKIDEFFNKDGIVCITEKDFDNIDGIVKKIATKEFYEERIEAVKDNFCRSLEYLSKEEYLFKHYGDKLRY